MPTRNPPCPIPTGNPEALRSRPSERRPLHAVSLRFLTPFRLLNRAHPLPTGEPGDQWKFGGNWHVHVTVYDTYVSRDSFESADFRVRCFFNAVLWRTRMPGRTQKSALNKRLEYMFYIHRIPDHYGLNLKYVRYWSEVEDVSRPAAVLQTPGLLYDKSFFDFRLLLLNHSPICGQNPPGSVSQSIMLARTCVFWNYSVNYGQNRCSLVLSL